MTTCEKHIHFKKLGCADCEQEWKEQTAEKDKPFYRPTVLPTAADLDAVALEQSIADATDISPSYRCPKCGAAVVIMAANCEVIAAPDGSIGVFDGFEWLPFSPARCYAACGWIGTAQDVELSEFEQPKEASHGSE